ncbi:MAG: hypothetical protein FJ290_15510 [Planctomycetes bacterium]|nr:hypothetical protein [Planctomycetota bacterium]
MRKWAGFAAAIALLAGCPRPLPPAEQSGPKAEPLAQQIGAFMEANRPYWCRGLMDRLEVTGPLPFEARGPGRIRVPDLDQGRANWKEDWDDPEFREYVAMDLHFDPEAKERFVGFFGTHWRDGDQVFHWTTPRITWMNLCGRAGYAHIRNGKLLEAILTLLN